MYPIYKLTLDESDEEIGMNLISLVGSAAMEVEAVKLSAEADVVTLKAIDEMKQYLTSAVIIPEKLIPRTNEALGKHYVKFSTDDVEKIRDKFFQKTGKLNLSNKNHVSDDTVDAQLIESWVIENPQMDKAIALGFKGLPKGTLMATYKVNDKNFWDNEVMTGNVTGFSLEGRFKHEEVKMSAEPKSAYQDIIDYIEELANEQK